MGASLSFSALAINESSANVQKYREQVAQKSRLYPDNELYELLEFEYNFAEIRRDAAKQYYKICLESEGKYSDVVNESITAVGIGLIAAAIAAIIAAIKKILTGSSGTSGGTAASKPLPPGPASSVVAYRIPHSNLSDATGSVAVEKRKEIETRKNNYERHLAEYERRVGSTSEAFENEKKRQLTIPIVTMKTKVTDYTASGFSKALAAIDPNKMMRMFLSEFDDIMKHNKDPLAHNSDGPMTKSNIKRAMKAKKELQEELAKAFNLNFDDESGVDIKLFEMQNVTGSYPTLLAQVDQNHADAALRNTTLKSMKDALEAHEKKLPGFEGKIKSNVNSIMSRYGKNLENREEIANAMYQEFSTTIHEMGSLFTGLCKRLETAFFNMDNADSVLAAYADSLALKAKQKEGAASSMSTYMKSHPDKVDYSEAAMWIQETSFIYDEQYTIYNQEPMNEGIGAIGIGLVGAAIAAIIAIIRKILHGSGSTSGSDASKPLPKEPTRNVAAYRIPHESLTNSTSTVAVEKRREIENRKNNYAKHLAEYEKKVGSASEAFENEKKRQLTVPIVTMKVKVTDYTAASFSRALAAIDPNKMMRIFLSEFDAMMKQGRSPEEGMRNDPSSKNIKRIKKAIDTIEKELLDTFNIDFTPGVALDLDLATIENKTGSYSSLKQEVDEKHADAALRSSTLKGMKDALEDHENKMKSLEGKVKSNVNSIISRYGSQIADREKTSQMLYQECSELIQEIGKMFTIICKKIETAFFNMDNADSVLAAYADSLALKAKQKEGAASAMDSYMKSHANKEDYSEAAFVQECSFIYDKQYNMDYAEHVCIYSEASFIHGEPFDGGTLYDEEDYQDFNRTDWVNLGLGEHYKDLENQGRIEEAAFKQECLYRVQPDFSVEKLRQLNEGVFEAAKNAMSKAIESLKELVKKFVEKLYAGFGSNKPYLDRYKDIWINKANPGGPFSSTGDIFVAMERIMRVPVPMLNYSQQAGALTDAATFFNTHCKKAFTDNFNGAQFSNLRRRADLNDWKGGDGGMSIADYCKQYFGYGNDNYKNQWNWSDLNSKNMQSIFDWLYDIKKIRDSIQKDQRNIEDSCQRIINEVKKSEQQNKVGNDTAQVNSKAESAAYSYVYQTYVTEMDTAGGTAPAGTAAANKGGNANNNTPTNTSGTGYNDTATAMNDINKNGPANPEEVRKAMNVYLDVVRTILTAKMTGLEFVRKELFALIRYKVNFYVGGNANQATAQSKQNNGGTQNAAPAQGGQTKPAGGPR